MQTIRTFGRGTYEFQKSGEIDEGLVAAKMNIAIIELQKNNIETAINLFERIASEEPAYQRPKQISY